MACSSNPDVPYVLCGQFTAGKEGHINWFGGFIGWFALVVMPTHICI